MPRRSKPKGTPINPFFLFCVFPVFVCRLPNFFSSYHAEINEVTDGEELFDMMLKSKSDIREFSRKLSSAQQRALNEHKHKLQQEKEAKYNQQMQDLIQNETAEVRTVVPFIKMSVSDCPPPSSSSSNSGSGRKANLQHKITQTTITVWKPGEVSRTEQCAHCPVCERVKRDKGQGMWPRVDQRRRNHCCEVIFFVECFLLQWRGKALENLWYIPHIFKHSHTYTH